MHNKDRFYNGIAHEFDQLMDEYDLKRRLEIVFGEMLTAEELHSASVLDAGCGTGWFSAEAAKRGANVVSLDIGPALLEMVGQKCDSLRTAGSILTMQFRDNTFDVVLCSEAIEHTTSPSRAVGELVRVLKPGGILVVTCPNRFWYWSCVVARILHLRPFKGHENWPGWWQLRGWLSGNGMKIEKMRGLHLFPFVIAATRPLLRVLDKFGYPFGAIYLNMAARGRKG